MKEQVNYSQEKRNFSLLISIIVGYIIENFLLYNIYIRELIYDQMLYVSVTLVLSLVFTMAFYRIFYYFISRWEPKLFYTDKKFFCRLITFFVLALCIAGSLGRYFAEYDSWKGQKILWISEGSILCLPVFFCIFLIASISIFNKEENSYNVPQLHRVMCIIAYCLTVAVYGAMMFVLNPLKGSVYHFTASLQSIYNVAYNTPFDITSSSIYGHYAIFFWPFLKAFGHRTEVIAIMFSIVAMISEAMLLYIIDAVVKRGLLKVLASLASIMPIISIYDYVYFQVHPLRTFPVIIMLFYCVLTQKKKWSGRKTILFGYILSSLSIVWITDVGIASTIAFSIYICAHYLKYNRLFCMKMLKVTVCCILGCVLSLFGMILIINIYNIGIASGAPIFRACFFPFVGGENFAHWITYRLEWGNNSWIWVLGLFFVAFIVEISKTYLLTKVTSLNGFCISDEVLCFSSILGFGQII